MASVRAGDQLSTILTRLRCAATAATPLSVTLELLCRTSSCKQTHNASMLLWARRQAEPPRNYSAVRDLSTALQHQFPRAAAECSHNLAGSSI